MAVRDWECVHVSVGKSGIHVNFVYVPFKVLLCCDGVGFGEGDRAHELFSVFQMYSACVIGSCLFSSSLLMTETALTRAIVYCCAACILLMSIAYFGGWPSLVVVQAPFSRVIMPGPAVSITFWW